MQVVELDLAHDIGSRLLLGLLVFIAGFDLFVLHLVGRLTRLGTPRLQNEHSGLRLADGVLHLGQTLILQLLQDSLVARRTGQTILLRELNSLLNLVDAVLKDAQSLLSALNATTVLLHVVQSGENADLKLLDLLLELRAEQVHRVRVSVAT